MNLNAATSLVAWLWDQEPNLIYALARQVPGPLGDDCFSCLFTGSACDPGNFTSWSCAGASIDPIAADAVNYCMPALSCVGLDSLDSVDFQSLGLCSGVCIPTLSESDLTPVGTCAVTGGCNIGTSSVSSTCASTSSALSGVAKFLTSQQGLTSLANVAAAYFKASAAACNAAAAKAAQQQAIVNAQLARALSGQSSLPIQYVTNSNGTTTPMISTTGGLLPLTADNLSRLTPSSIATFFAQYGTWLVIGGAAAFLAYAATRRRAT